MKIKGFNLREQKLFDILRKADGPRTIAQLKTHFHRDAKAHLDSNYKKGWKEGALDEQAQSFVRNGIRRLIRDGWAEGPAQAQLPRGTYRLSKAGMRKVTDYTDTTASFTTRRRKNTATPAKMQTRTKKERNGKSVPKKVKAGTARAAIKTVKEKAKAAAKRAGRQTAREKAAAAGRRAASQIAA